MNRKRYSSLLFGLLALSLILFGIPWKAFAGNFGSESDLAANPELAVLRNYAVSDSSGHEKLFVADAARWAALGGYYTGMFTGLTPAVEAKLILRAVPGVDQKTLVADAARWAALGGYYSGMFTGLTPSVVEKVPVDGATRWAALGGYYTGMYTGLTPARADALIRRAALVNQGRQADSARWVALGDFYSAKMARTPGVVGVLSGQYRDSIPHVAKVDVLGAFHAAEARRAALDVYFKALVARGTGTDVLGASYASRYLGENPELIVVRGFDDLVFNPELIFVRSDDVVSNPELLSLRQYNICGC
jgi:hypothetical protein